MKPVHILMAVLLASGLADGRACAQVARQTLTFAVFGQYQTNQILTNSSYTNENKIIETAELSTANIVKALAIDYAGTNWASLTSATLVRETDFADGPDGGERIFLYRDSPPTNICLTNFDLSFTNNFTADVTNLFPGVTNLGVNPVVTGGVFPGGATNIGSLVSAGLFAINFHTTNLQFNLVGYGTTAESDFQASYRGARYSGPVQTLQFAGVGTFSLNVSTNFFAKNRVGNPNTNFVSGPAHGSLITGAPVFITNSVANLFGP